MRIFRARIEPILFYGAQTWAITATLAKTMDSCYTRMLRKALGWKFRDRKSSEEIYKGMEKPSKFVQKRRIEFVGHCICSDNQPMGKFYFWEAAQQPLCKGKGRKMTYEKLILSDLPDMELQEIVIAARNSEEWKNVTKLD